MIAAGAEAIIVGSAIINKISDPSGNKMLLPNLQKFARSMKNACKKK
jgi:tryptophan synthase alpha subunit